MAKMPKRNKSKDNPYTLDFDEENNTYTVEFIDNKKVIHKVEISEEVYQAFDKFELEDISQIHKYRSHIEHSEVYEDSLNNRQVDKPLTLEEEVEQKLLLEDIKKAFSVLTETQRRRFKMYYYDDLNFKQIAEKECCDESSVRESIYKGIEKIQKKLK